jgi:hypothetical protein
MQHAATMRDLRVSMPGTWPGSAARGEEQHLLGPLPGSRLGLARASAQLQVASAGLCSQAPVPPSRAGV